MEKLTRAVYKKQSMEIFEAASDKWNDIDVVYLEPEFIVNYSHLLYNLKKMVLMLEEQIEEQKSLPDNVIPFPRKRVNGE